MAESLAQSDSMFPKLNAAQIGRLVWFGRRRPAKPGEILFDQGESKRGVFAVIEGQIEIVSPSKTGAVVLAVHGAGDFSGDVSILTGRNSLVQGRVREESDLI